MQNEPNFRKSQMFVNKVLTKDYDKRTLGERGKNEPKTNPIYPVVAFGEAGLKPNLQNARMNVSTVLTNTYEQRTMNNELIKTNPIYPVVAFGEAGTNPKNSSRRAGIWF